MKRQFVTKKIEKCDKESSNLERAPECFKTQESLSSENLTKYYLYKGIFFMFFSTLKDTIQAQSKTNDLFSQNFVIICLKHIQRNVICSLFCQYQPKAPF